MARLEITDKFIFATIKGHVATDWQVALDEDFENLIVNIEKDTTNLTYLKIALPDNIEDGTITYARCRIWIEDRVSAWFKLNDCTM